MTRVISRLAILPFVLLAGCAMDSDQSSALPSTTNPSPGAYAVLTSASDSNVTGRLAFSRADGGVRITGRISGLKPDSVHGFHIHENGDCSAPDASSAGGHFNPQHQPHGRAKTGPHHAGDIPNQQAGADGVANVNALVQGIELGTGSDTDVIGSAIIVHAQPDDYTSQPSGDAGARIACGVITRS